MDFLVPKNRRIVDLNNVPLVNGTAFVKWRLPSSSGAENHGHTDKAVIIDHRAYWNYEKTLQVRLTIDRNQSLHDCELQFEIIQEFESGGSGDTKNFLGRIRLNLAEYVDKSDDDEGIVRRYLMQDSKVNSTLKVGVAMRQVEGDRNFTTPPLKSAMAFGGITGVISAEQTDPDDLGPLPSIHMQSREAADMQDMYRRTLAASWNSRSDDVPADKLVEDLFSGSISWSNEVHGLQSAEAKGGEHFPSIGAATKNTSANRLSPNFERRPKSSSSNQFRIDENDDLLDNDLVMERIESFRAHYRPGDKLSPTDWENLRSGFQTSFTNQQLSDYIEQFKAEDTVQEEGLNLHGGAKLAEWRPGTSAFLETESAPQAGAARRVAKSLDLRGKYVLTERILRDCWHLGLIGEVGQLDIRLPAHSLSLFLHSEHFSFEELAGLHDAKIDITHSLGLVRITGKQHSCEFIRDIIYDATTRIREEDLELYPPGATPKGKNRVFTADFLSWVSKTYGVSFDLTTTTPTKLFYLAENKPKADSARRTLNLAIHDATQPPIPFGTYMAASEPVDTYDINPELNVSWFDRQKSWFRWAVPSAQTAPSSMSDAPFFNKHEMRLSDELLKLLRARTRTKLGNAEAHESITAAVGRCLFEHKPFEGKAITAAQLGKMAPPRTFTTDIPRVIPFLHQLTADYPEDEEIQPHRLRLVPSALHAHIFPQLELEVAMAPGGFEYNVQNAKAILSQSSVDYLLPESGLDLRFTRKLTHDVLDSFGEDAPLQPLQDSLQDFFSKAVIYEGETPLPAFSQLSIPNHLLVETGEERDPDGFTTAEYMYLPVNDFRGTRLHQYDYEGHRLNYSFYESGPFSPHRTTDIFLDMDVDGSEEQSPSENGDSQEPVQQEFGSFYKAACSLAFELDRSGRAM
ncbi:hypothetical protein BDV24DRAFT_153532 [Aspergillus arachidicola]|uniref:C2 NT-type domain-containing protein n=1 Tax=Aspergillus arachidicola TaxID=656916 RepID=A0A5N6Y1U8_9EURO|nr:hypothetical protein BDV24DRAFT_153532 [Aspergillus arachidicola]